ncbi:uncharacterized protein LOC127283492 [Leptopilina boulardi]|uniref:uncharacterized protein LOC127283492 n=1 Tax=Leptopilina boulardi TaxID=63433 RepID=UPI0021F55C6D|nr:uncharacterized protein LOC127283492 [Leptopilina boulardi]
MDIEIVNKSFCERILQQHQKNKKIKVLELSKELATSKGDNFLSEIYRIFIKYTNSKNGNAKINEETSIILKIKLANLSIGAEAIDEVFYTESNVFKNILSKIEKYTDCSIGPFLYEVNENSNYIVMEDLGRLRYAIQDKSKGLTFQQCLKAIEKMAKFHAGSVRIAETEPELLQCYDQICPWDVFPKTFYKFMTDSLITISKQIEEKFKEDEYQKIACKLKKMSNNFETKVLSVFKHSDSEFCVLNHGDFWINNVMLQTNEKGETTDARMVDFQLVTYTSPAIDLSHFLAMCPEMLIKGDKDEYFLEKYLATLTKTMEKIGCKTKPPTKQELEESMKKRGVHSIVTGIIFYPRLQADKEDIEDFVDVMSEGETKLDLFKYPLAVNIIRKFSRIINDKGYLEC